MLANRLADASPGPVGLIGSHELLIFLLQVGLLLLLALVLGRLATRVGLPALVGELLAGVIMGPTVLGNLAPRLSGWLLPHRAEQFHLLDAAGQFSVVMLIGITGSQLDFGLLRRAGTTALRVSIPGLAIPLGLGVALGYLLPATFLLRPDNRAVFALFLGVAMCVTAIPVVAKILTDMRLIHRNIGQLIIATGTIDDACGWLLLSVVAALVAHGLRPADVLRSVLLLGGFVAVALLCGRPIIRHCLRLAARAQDAGPTIATVTVVIVLGAAGAEAAGLEAVFGGFVAGVVVGTCGELDPARPAPLRTVVLWVLAPVFFATVGLRIDLALLGRPIVLAAAAAVLAIAITGKFAGAYAGALMSRLTKWEALALGAGMNARGVIQLIVASVGLRLGVLSIATYTIIVLTALITSLMAPPILRLAMRRIEQTAEEKIRESKYAAL
jgi:Kef-type K+ transport system membrane component KefB